MTSSNDIDRQLANEASQWVSRLTFERPEDFSAELTEWLCRSPNHVEEFLVARHILARLQNFDRQRLVDIDELVKSASANVISLRDSATQADPDLSIMASAVEKDAAGCSASDAPLKLRRWRGGILAVAGISVLFIALALGLRFMVYPSYSTGVGERRTIHLADGSFIELNTRSNVRVHLTRKVRSVDLLSGEALFRVARDRSRPFLVSTRNAVVRAIGTQFDVYVRNDLATQVAVVEGQVQVVPESGYSSTAIQVSLLPGSQQFGTSAVMLTAGEQVDVRGEGAIFKPSHPDVSKAVAWRNGRILFSSTPLADVVKEFSRYSDFRIQLEGQGIAQRQISGVFPVDDPQMLVLLFEQDDTVSVTRIDNGIVVKPRR